ncbi:hypothetical protein BASA61_005275 [Batrachochytrium salamandrivorans]|nr:hypothetical protein BASA62_001396 [Batrachochytrium salamandrivorans]KAH6580154.1 hypothetical protein BASA60_002971 [Batrachochytrium salamandrivorans]KAH6590516.1 hypothetical protein BASA61_005275 [Batrachochytrium salamandrivorans]KAJ1338862.1 hypothetical protein BSLG_006499 [Batrachochytrium salamandrivorans]
MGFIQLGRLVSPVARSIRCQAVTRRTLGTSVGVAQSSGPLVAPLKPEYSAGERMIHEKLANQLQATRLNVADISGGCGSMYAVEIASPMFYGISLVKQHRIVTDLLKDDIKAMHGIQIKTSASQTEE